ncbi:MAG: UDP-N-acetylmuramoyl-L-alanyl-D-glutamate--2,6-diaminopimelate ligase, partial [Deltaproteobacteria bacterium]|nr:UDP-N-acetylmuramoyl-L-alanyl-D-glutamate--2,6-diaminopimelate ligase [Deltaproteobacteria bacterium]
LKEMVQSSVGYVVMEVSSHSLDQHRVEKIEFACGIFTNLTLDHLDYHKDMKSYFDAKARLFQSLAPSAKSILNQDDPYTGRLKSLTRAKVITYGFDPASDVRPLGLKLDLNGIEMEIATPEWRCGLKSKLLGRHNVYNLLAGAASAWAEGIKPSLIIEGLSRLERVPGRLEQVHAGQPYAVFVDYAHTDDALKNILSTLRELTKERIILVFGCGGDRDKSKRPLMGNVATRLADLAIITSDNPRSEDPAAIIKDIESGIDPGRKNYEIVVEREDAIRKALYSAEVDDTVVIAGKGHEPYQILKDTYIPFDDREVVRKILHGGKG